MSNNINAMEVFLFLHTAYLLYSVRAKRVEIDPHEGKYINIFAFYLIRWLAVVCSVYAGPMGMRTDSCERVPNLCLQLFRICEMRIMALRSADPGPTRMRTHPNANVLCDGGSPRRLQLHGANQTCIVSCSCVESETSSLRNETGRSYHKVTMLDKISLSIYKVFRIDGSSGRP